MGERQQHETCPRCVLSVVEAWSGAVVAVKQQVPNMQTFPWPVASVDQAGKPKCNLPALIFLNSSKRSLPRFSLCWSAFYYAIMTSSVECGFIHQSRRDKLPSDGTSVNIKLRTFMPRRPGMHLETVSRLLPRLVGQQHTILHKAIPFPNRTQVYLH